MEMKKGASLSDLKDKLRATRSMPPPTASRCIHKVPPSLRKVNEKVYTPILVSIGPFHHGNPRLESMQQLKLWYLKRFLERTKEKSLEDYAKFLQGLEENIRCCYSEAILIESDEFVSMILTDAYFIIEVFYAIIYQPADDLLVINLLWPMKDIMQDLILLENQLPFFVLEALFHQTFPTGFNGCQSFSDITSRILLRWFPANIYHPYNMTLFENPSFAHEVKHLCDMLRTFYLPSHPPPRQPQTNHPHLKRSCSVSQLHEVGIKLQANQGKRSIEVEYLDGVLKIPGIRGSDWLEIILLNVVAFEQCHLIEEHYLTDYVILLDFFITSGKDVQVLVEEGIMENDRDNDTVASMISNLCKEVVEIDLNSEYISLHMKSDEFYNNHYNKYKAIFVREYWSTPWKKASLIAAVLLLFLTFIQTICSFIPIFKK